MDNQTISNGAVAQCCQDPALRRLIGSTKKDDTISIIERCIECGRRHYIMIVPPVKIGVHGAGLG